MSQSDVIYSIFFFNDTATTEIYTLSLHDALPICYGLNYHTAPLPQQVGSAWHKIIRLSLPNGWLDATNRKNLPSQLVKLYKATTGDRRTRRRLQAEWTAAAAA